QGAVLPKGDEAGCPARGRCGAATVMQGAQIGVTHERAGIRLLGQQRIPGLGGHFCRVLEHADLPRWGRWNVRVHRHLRAYRGNSQGSTSTHATSTRSAKGTPMRTKSMKWYWPGPSTRVFTGDDTGVMKAADAARATVMAKG